MIIESLELLNFRNYERECFEFDKNTNVLYGDNAQGKTNVLEAIYFCSTSRSHNGSKDKQMIRFKMPEAHLRMNILKDEIHRCALTILRIPMRICQCLACSSSSHTCLMRRPMKMP